MKRLSLQWRITLMSVLLIGITCVAMNLLLCSSGVYYMDTIADSLQGGGTVILNDGGAASFDPQLIAPNEELTIVVDGVQGRFRTTNWYITAAVTLLSGILAYFVSGRALKPLRSFASQVEQVQLNNLADMRIDEDVSEFRQLSRSFNQMLERLNNAFAAQRQFTGNAAHELRTPLALMQAQLELFSAEHPDVLPETAEFLTLLREQTERLTQMTKTLLEMSNLQQVARNEQIQLAPMVEEIFTDLAPLAEKRSITLEAEGDGALTGSDALIYRLLFNLTENAVKYNRPGGSVRVELAQGAGKAPHPRFRHRLRHSGGVSAEHLSSPSSGWTSPAAASTAARDWGFLWCGRSPISTAAPFGWRKARTRARPSRWSCRQGRKTIPPARISHNSPRRFHGDRFSTSTTLSQQLSISSLSWVITRMVLPFRASLFSLSAIRRIFCPSRPLVGSSRISILRPEKMAQAMARRCFCPPDRADGCASLYS